MIPYVTWAAVTVMMVAGVLSTWVLRQRPHWSTRAAAVMSGSGVVMLSNEALRPQPTAYIGAWVLIAGLTFMNWSVCRRAERDHHRRTIETLELLAELNRIHQLRQREAADRVGIWPSTSEETEA